MAHIRSSACIPVSTWSQSLGSADIVLHSFSGAAAAGTAQPLFAIYLKSTKKYTVAQINNYPTAISGVSVVSALVYAWVSDGPLKGRRWPVLIWAAVGLFPLNKTTFVLVRLLTC